jgi:hypothetical protein
MPTPSFKRNLFLLCLLLWCQRGLRLLLRAAWTGTAAFIIGWNVSVQSDRLPDFRASLLFAGIVASFSLAGIFAPWPRLHRLAWRLDRHYGFQEQVSAAWQVIRGRTPGEIAWLLVADAATLLPKARNRILWRGWFLFRELLSAAVVLLLFWLLFGQELAVTPPAFRQVEVANLPALGNDPTADDLFPFGIPGLEPVPTERSSNAGSQAGDSGSGENGGASQADREGSGTLSPEVASALQQLGKELNRHAVGYDAGDALQKGDLEGAAQALELMADQVDKLSETTQNELADAFREAGEQMDGGTTPAEEALAQSLQKAADSLDGGQKLQARDDIDQIAADLRELDRQVAQDMGGGEGVGGSQPGASPGSRERGAAESFERLQGEGETLQLGDESEESAGILTSGKEEQNGQGAAGGAVTTLQSGDQEVVVTMLVPYIFQTRWRDVVATYFTPR